MLNDGKKQLRKQTYNAAVLYLSTFDSLIFRIMHNLVTHIHRLLLNYFFNPIQIHKEYVIDNQNQNPFFKMD